MKKRTERKIKRVTAAIIAIILCMFMVILVLSFTSCTPGIVKAINGYDESLHRAYDDSNYYTKKEVEDTCRAMISSYETDKTTYLQYKDSDNETKQEWAEEAKMRANKTANTYNNYVLKNSYVWENNVPDDIKEKLEIIQ